MLQRSTVPNLHHRMIQYCTYDTKQQYSARSGAAGSSMGNLISGGSESQPSSARGRRQAPGGNSTIVIG